MLEVEQIVFENYKCFKKETKIHNIKPINVAINHYSEGNVEITNRGNLKIGRIGMQRKGGDGCRETANMLQFKVDPIELFNVN